MILIFMISYAESKVDLDAMFDFADACGLQFDKPEITLISDRGSAIISSVSERYKHLKHHHCAKHIERNLKQRGWNRFIGLFWNARNACTFAKYQAAMNEIKNASLQMYQYLSSIKNWCLYELIEKHNKIFGIMSSNIVESKMSICFPCNISFF